MRRAKVLWTPHPYKAGFSITDDTDRATYQQVKIVYDHLRDIGFPVTKTVWSFEPQEPCGVPPMHEEREETALLVHDEYFQYCKQLASEGFEICSHGASGGNNPREFTLESLELLQQEFGQTDTYIQHSKNACNLYYEEKVANDPVFRFLLKLYSRNKCFGEVEGSKYFWGDVCRERIKQIRLFRTRNTNTLAVNPSMPYYDANKPYVRSWFAATRRAFADCATSDAIDKLKRENGLTVLYQYLRSYADLDTNRVTDEFHQGTKRLVDDGEIWLAPVRDTLDRLRAMQGLFVVYRGLNAWLVNTGDDIEKLQMVIPEGVEIDSRHVGLHRAGDIVVVKSVPGGKISQLEFSKPLRWEGRAVQLGKKRKAICDFGFGKIYVNLATRGWDTGNTFVPPGEYKLEFNRGLRDIQPLSKASFIEEYRMILHQMWIIMRQILFRGRSLSTKKYVNRQIDDQLIHVGW
ncbi:MAG: hypothetical protein CL946_05025 [Ectothiorhodospiraceae bacterium]|nr:hypothetical protein [Ectothiorhodospiraceae bacterium]